MLPAISMNSEMTRPAFDALPARRKRPHMEKTLGKRRHERFACGSPVQWAYFNKPETHGARMLNFSRAGMRLESRKELVPGAAVVVRLMEYRAECLAGCRNQTDCPWPRSIAVGEVKWCRGAASGPSTSFGAGVKFHLPV